MINYITIAACAVTFIVTIITMIVDYSGFSNEISEKKLLEIRKNIKNLTNYLRSIKAKNIIINSVIGIILWKI